MTSYTLHQLSQLIDHTNLKPDATPKSVSYTHLTLPTLSVLKQKMRLKMVQRKSIMLLISQN